MRDRNQLELALKGKFNVQRTRSVPSKWRLSGDGERQRHLSKDRWREATRAGPRSLWRWGQQRKERGPERRDGCQRRAGSAGHTHLFVAKSEFSLINLLTLLRTKNPVKQWTMEFQHTEFYLCSSSFCLSQIECYHLPHCISKNSCLFLQGTGDQPEYRCHGLREKV